MSKTIQERIAAEIAGVLSRFSLSSLRQFALSQARTPAYEGTEETDWSSPALSDYLDALGIEDVSQWSDLSGDARQRIVEHTLLGDPDTDTFDEANVLPVVNPSTGRLNANALRSAISLAPQMEGVSQETIESAQAVARRLLEEEYSDGEREGSEGERREVRFYFAAPEGMSHRDLEEILRNAISETDGGPVWVTDVFDHTVIYERALGDELSGEDVGLFARSYMVTPEGEVTLGERTEVRRETQYVPVSTGEDGDMDTMRLFLARLRELIQERVEGADLSAEAFNEAVRIARRHVQGEPRASGRQASELSAIAGHDGPLRLFHEYRFADAPAWIPYLPRPGTYKHPQYGEIVLTRERNERFADNINNRVYGQDIPIDAEHKPQLSGAVAYVKAARVTDKGAVDVRVEWTDRGRALVESDGYRYFSPEWYDTWCDPVTEECFEDVAVGGAITKRPFFKELALAGRAPLVASERGLFIPPDDDETILFTGESRMSKAQETQTAEELQARIDELEQQVEEANEARQAAEQALEQAQDDGGEGGPGTGEDGLKAMSEELKQAREQNKQLAERVQALEGERRRARFTELVEPKDGPRWFGEVDQHVSMLEKLSDAFGEDSDEFSGYVQQQQAIAEQMEMSDLFQSRGSDRSGGGSAGARLDAEAKKLQEQHPELTYEQAYARAAEQNPQLYNETIGR